MCGEWCKHYDEGTGLCALDECVAEEERRYEEGRADYEYDQWKDKQYEDFLDGKL